MTKKRKGSGGNPATAAARRAQAQARGLGLHEAFEKQALDMMHVRALERYGLGIGVIVQEEDRWRREAESHAKARAELPGWRLFKRQRLVRLERGARSNFGEWSRRFKVVALDVANLATDGPDDVAQTVEQR